MNPNYVVSLELADKLRELGVPQRSEFWHAKSFWGDGTMIRWDIVDKETFDKVPFDEGYSAYLSDELLEWLPEKYLNWLTILKTIPGDLFRLSTRDLSGHSVDEFDASTFSNALAKMLIYLLEQGIVKVEELK